MVQGSLEGIPDSKVYGANMGPTWGRQDPGGPHVGPMNFALWGLTSPLFKSNQIFLQCQKMVFSFNKKNMEFFMLHDEVSCIHFAKYYESVIHCETWVNIQNKQGFKKMP